MSILLVHSKNTSRRSQLIHIKRYAERHRERFLLVMADPTWENEIADRVICVDTADIGRTLLAVDAAARDEAESIRGVVTFSEHSVPAAAAVAARLGVPFVSERTAETARDKYAMRCAFSKAGLLQPAYGLARDLGEARKQAARIGYPLVTKPLIGGGSMYIRRLDNDADLAAHLDPLRKGAWTELVYDPLHRRMIQKYEGAALLEGYVAGIEVSVESVVVGGNTRVVAIHDKPFPLEGPNFEEYFYRTPSLLPPATIHQVKEATARAHEALGITIGATHTEFRITSDGEPTILECAARLGGGPLYQTVLGSTGVDMVHAVLDLAMGREPDLTPTRQTPAGFCQFFASKAGRITAITGVEEALAQPGVHELSVYCSVGDTIGVPPFVWQGFGHAYFTANSHDQLVETYQTLQRSVRLSIDERTTHLGVLSAGIRGE